MSRNRKSSNFDPADHAEFLRENAGEEGGRKVIKEYIDRAVDEGNVDDVFHWASVAAHHRYGRSRHPDEFLSFEVQEFLRKLIYNADGE